MASTINATPTSSGLISTADNSGVLALQTGGTTAVTVTAGQLVGIGTTSPTAPLTVYAARYDTLRVGRSNAASFAIGIPSGSATDSLEFNGVQAGYDGYLFTGASGDKLRITSAGLLQFNSGYGSVATAYGCRVWVLFNGTGTVGILASANVSSVVDNGNGNYYINFATTMPSATWAGFVTTSEYGGSGSSFTYHGTIHSRGASGTGINTTAYNTGTALDDAGQINFTLFR